MEKLGGNNFLTRILGGINILHTFSDFTVKKGGVQMTNKIKGF